jgi:uncharacterized membrane protein YqgA involved in biofilm formation
MAFVSFSDGGVMLAAIPVALAFQEPLPWLLFSALRPFLESHGLHESVNATGGLLVFSRCLSLFAGLKRIELADYLPV